MKLQKFTALIVAIGGIAFGALPSHAALVPNPQSGDLFIGFRASGGEGASSSYLINIGLDTIYRNAAPGSSFTLGSLGNIAADLVGAFGEDWSERADLYWGVFGHRTNNGSAIVYGSRERIDINTPAAAWQALDQTSRNATDSQILSVLENTSGYKGREATSNSAVATFQSNFDGAASYNKQVATPGTTDFGSLSGWTTIEGNFGEESVLDLFRIAGTGVSNVGSFSISDEGIISFTAVPEPSTYALLGAAALLALISYQRNRRKLSA